MEQLNLNNEQQYINQQLPHNFLAEKIILSCLLVSSEAIEMTLKTLPINAFYFKNHQDIYKAIIFLYENQIPIDPLTLLNCLQDMGQLEKVGGIKVLIELLTQVPNLIHLEDYIQLVKDKFIRRSLIRLGYEMINSGYITNLPLEKILQELETKLFNITGSVTPQNFLSSAEVLNTIFIELKEKSVTPSLSGISSGFYSLDSLTQGFQKSDLIVIAGRPSMGKTAFGLNIAVNVIKSSKLPVLFFSLEMSKEQIMYRVLSMETNINQMRLKSGKLYSNDWIKVNKMIKLIAKFPLFIDDTSELSVQDIRSKLKTLLFEQNQIGLVVIDYLQLMKSSNVNTENRVQELATITRSLKILAREFTIPVIVLSQLSRNVENRTDKKPILSDLRESGSIEQDADMVLMLSRNNYYERSQNEIPMHQEPTDQFIELIIAKQRNGPLGKIKLKFDDQRTKFSNVDNE